VEDGGGRFRSRPGTILAHANARLRKYGRRLGPNPASGQTNLPVKLVVLNNGTLGFVDLEMKAHPAFSTSGVI